MSALPAVAWRRSAAPVPYPEAVAAMEERVALIRAGRAPELAWLLEHPALYTAGTSARPDELLDPGALPVFKSGRGGQYAYHGPGQRIAYVLLDLGRRGADLRAHVRGLEEWAIRALARLGIAGERRSDRIGVWVSRRPPADGEDKIAAIGVRVRHWVTYHGLAINLDPRLEHFAGIVPCGIAPGRFGVTSLRALGSAATLADLDAALIQTFAQAFGAPLAPAEAPARDWI